MADVGEIKYVASIDTSAYKKGASDIDSANKNIEKSTDDADKSVSKFSKTGAAAFGLVSGAAFALANKAIAAVSSSIDGAIKRVDTLINAPQVLQNLGFSATESAKAIKQIDKGVQGLPTSLDAIASTLVSIASASGKSIDEATDLTLAFNNMALAGGKGTQDAQRALMQFTQALGKGTLPAQEFNTLMEVMPAQMTQVAKTLLGGEASAIQLRDAMSDGSITMDQFSDTIVKLDKKGGKNFASFADQAKDATGGIETSWSLVQTAITRGIASIITSIGSGNITNSFDLLKDAIDTTFKSVNGFIGFVKDNKDIFSTLAVGIVAASTAVIVYNSVIKLMAIYQAAVNTATILYSAYTNAVSLGLGRATAAQIAMNVALSANPIGIVTIAVAALAAGLAWFFTQTETGRKIMEGFFSFMSESFTNIGKWSTDTWNGITKAFSNAWTNIKNIFGGIGGFFKGIWDNIVSIFGKIGTAIGGAIGGAFKGVMNGIIGFVESTVNGIIKSINSVAKGIDEALPGDQSSWRVSEVRLPRFFDGGFTGRGGKFDEAGIVHRGEYVLPQSMVNQSTGLPNASAIDAFGSGSSPDNSSTYNLNFTISGAIVTSPQDQRKFAEVIGKKINEVMTQKGYKPALEGM